MDPQLFDILWEVVRDLGAKEPIHIVSSYRSPATNPMLRRRSRGVAQFTQHTLGKAIDFNITGRPGRPTARSPDAAAARRRRVLSGLVRAHGRRLGAALAAHGAGPARAPVPERPHRAHPVERPAALRLRARARRHREARRLDAVEHVAGLGAQRRRDRRRGARRARRVRRQAEEGQFFAAVRLLDGDEEDEDQPVGNTVVAKRARSRRPPRVPLPQARPQIQVAARDGEGRRLCARLRDVRRRSTSTRRSAPRPPAPIADEASASRAETTASINSWLKDTEARADRVPADLALAYAAAAVPEGSRPVAGASDAAHRARGDLADRAHPAEGRTALQRSVAARHHTGLQRALRHERQRLRQARRAPGAHHDDQAGVEPDDGVRRRSL